MTEARTAPADRLDAAIAWFTSRLARYWLHLTILFLVAFLALPIAAPLLAMTGHARPAGWIYLFYRIACHQLPQRSYFIGGEALTYDWSTVRPYLGLPEDGMYLAIHHPLGNAALGWQLALCERDMAIWAAVLLVALVYAWRRRRQPTKPLPFRLYALALVPIAVDGLSQLFGFRESTPLLRTVTGALFGAATGLLVLPHLEMAFRDLAGPEGGG